MLDGYLKGLKRTAYQLAWLCYNVVGFVPVGMVKIMVWSFLIYTIIKPYHDGGDIQTTQCPTHIAPAAGNLRLRSASYPNSLTKH